MEEDNKNLEQGQQEEDIEDIVGQDASEDEGELDWKAAAKKLKKAVETITDSLDDYFKKIELNKLRNRYNNKERSKGLFDAIMKL